MHGSFMKWSRVLLPESAERLQVVRMRNAQLDRRCRFAIVDGSRHAAEIGCWMCYVPALKTKLFHASHGTIDSIHASRPDDETLKRSGLVLGRYTSDDWRRALSTTLTRRLAEIWLVSVRLWRAGLGPQPLGVCFVDRFCRDDHELGPTCGLLTQNVRRLRRKLPCRIEQIRQAGVIPDRIESCVRQQIRGYVTDLCSVVGCMPENAEPAVTRLEKHFESDMPERRLLKLLDESMA